MKPKFSISESEWQVLACLWKQSPMEIKDIVTALYPRTGWNANMVRTLVVRLQEKGAVGKFRFCTGNCNAAAGSGDGESGECPEC